MSLCMLYIILFGASTPINIFNNRYSGKEYKRFVLIYIYSNISTRILI